MLRVNFMGFVNRVMVGQDRNGRPIVNIDLPVNASRPTVVNGQRQYDTYWMRLSAFGDLAAQMLRQIPVSAGGQKSDGETGGLVHSARIEGTAVFVGMDKYTDKNGVARETPRWLLTDWGYVNAGRTQQSRQNAAPAQTQQPMPAAAAAAPSPAPVYQQPQNLAPAPMPTPAPAPAAPVYQQAPVADAPAGEVPFDPSYNPFM